MLFALLLTLSEPMTGLQLQRFCNGGPGTFAHAACVFYVSGYEEGVRAANASWEGTKRPFVCLPDGLTPEDLRTALLESLKVPGRRAAPASAVMLATLAETWPCRRP